MVSPFSLLLIFKVVAAILTIAILGRLILLLLSAELGRKADLTRKLHKAAPQFPFALVIPLTSMSQTQELFLLFEAVLKQPYPAHLIEIHLVMTQSIFQNLSRYEDKLPKTAKCWVLPKTPQSLQLVDYLSWGIDRVLAQGGGSRLVVALNPTDMIREDFFEQLAHQAVFSGVVQFYLALKRKPKGLLSTVNALSLRLFNRVRQAGRKHLGLPGILTATGWMIHQDILEKLPIRIAGAGYPLAYQCYLDQASYPVQWAPSVMVYQNEHVSFTEWLQGLATEFTARFSALQRHLLRVPVGLMRPKTTLMAFQQLYQLFRLPDMVLITLLVSGWLASASLQLPISEFFRYISTAFVLLQGLGLLVARFTLVDIAKYALLSPLVYITSYVLLPLHGVIKLLEQPMQHLVAASPIPLGAKRTPARQLVLPTQQVPWLKEAVEIQQLRQQLPVSLQRPVTVTIGNGPQRLECQVSCHVQASGPDGAEHPFYQLILTYRGAQFETQQYHALDDAYEELQQKLQLKGFYLFSCGSCAYFYRKSENDIQGYCIYGRKGNPIQPEEHPTIHQLSLFCTHHRDQAFRQDEQAVFEASIG